MNRKYDNTSAFSFQKAISFKTATIIVIALHLFGFFGVTQWSAYKTKLSREKRQEEYAKRIELAETEKFNWPEGKTKVVATPSVPNTKPVLVASSKPSTTPGVFAKLTEFLFSKPRFPVVVASKDSETNKAYNQKMAEVSALIDRATNRLSQKANELASLEASLKKKQDELDKRTKEQQIISSTTRTYKSNPHKTTPPRSVSSAVASTETPKPKTHTSYSKQAATSSPIVISPDTVKTYTKNGMQYIDVVDTSKIMSSHIVLQ